VSAALGGFDLGELEGQRVDRLSMGQRQRVRLAQTFLHDPGLVLLDEPHTSLDDAGLALIERAIDGVRHRGGAVLWCSPATAELPLEADAHYVLCDGAVGLR
jgi:ABC-type Mn2+/Zn2+ transport system ATPase subunit